MKLKYQVLLIFIFLGHLELKAQNSRLSKPKKIKSSVYKDVISKQSNDSNPIKIEFGFISTTVLADSEPITIQLGEAETQVPLHDEVSSQKTTREIETDHAINKEDESSTYALFIGISEYEFATQGFGNLNKPVADAQAFKELLVADYQFTEANSILLENPNKSEILKNIETLARKIDKNDNLLIFYAGHGYWDDFLKVGYWLANDAKIDDKSTWLSNSNLRDYITAIPSKHTLLITDACFSGGIFQTRSAENVGAYATSKLYQLPSRKALTSGTLTKVPDESVFIKYLMKRLVANEEAYLPVSQLFYSIRPAVLNNSSTVPQLGVIQNTGDEGGEFVFMKNTQ